MNYTQNVWCIRQVFRWIIPRMLCVEDKILVVFIPRMLCVLDKTLVGFIPRVWFFLYPKCLVYRTRFFVVFIPRMFGLLARFWLDLYPECWVYSMRFWLNYSHRNIFWSLIFHSSLSRSSVNKKTFITFRAKI